MEEPSFRILIVDDNKTNRAILQKLAEFCGYEVDLATNGEEAVAAVRDNRYGLVLMDIQMPILDGMAAPKQIHEETAVSDRPLIVAVTGSANHEERIACRELGMFDLIAKPFRLEEIKLVIARAVTSWQERTIS